MSLIRRTALAGAAVALLAGCTTTVAGKPVTPTGGTPSGTASPATLRSTLLMAGDLPSSWTSTPHQRSDDNGDSADDQALQAQLATCVGVPSDSLDDDDSSTVHSADFKSGQSAISSDARPVDPARSKLTEQIVNSPKTDQCLAQTVRALLTKSLPGGTGTPDVSAHVSGRRSGQPNNVVANLDAVVTLAVQGRSLALYIDETEVRSNTVEASVDFEGFGARIPTSVTTAALTAVSERVAKT